MTGQDSARGVARNCLENGGREARVPVNKGCRERDAWQYAVGIEAGGGW